MVNTGVVCVSVVTIMVNHGVVCVFVVQDFSMEWFIHSAQQYRVTGRTIPDLCDHNAAVALGMNRHQVSVGLLRGAVWNIRHVKLGELRAWA